MIAVTMTVNQQAVSAEVEPRTLLIDFLRDRLRLTGAHVGCDTAQCGACVVHVDGKSVKSFAMLAVQANGLEVLTIEGLHRAGALNPVQRAFHEHHALQCGFCTPGMVMSAIELLERPLGWREIFAAAPATATSSPPSAPPPGWFGASRRPSTQRCRRHGSRGY